MSINPEDCHCCNPPWLHNYKGVDLVVVGITQRELDNFLTTPTSVNEGDYGSFIAPSGPGNIKGIAQPAPYAPSAPNRVWWLTGSRESEVTTRKIDNFLDLGVSTLDFGADSHTILSRHYTNSPAVDYYVIVGGEANTNGDTIVAWQDSDLVEAWTNNALDVRVSGMVQVSLVGSDLIVVGLGNGVGTGTINAQATIAAIVPLGGSAGLTKWTMDPTGGVGEATSIDGPTIDGEFAVGYKDLAGTGTPANFNVVLAKWQTGGGSVLDTKSMLNGSDILSVLFAEVGLSGAFPIIIGAGVGDGTNTVECRNRVAFDLTGPTGGTIDDIRWSYNTGSTVRSMTFYFSIGILGTGTGTPENGSWVLLIVGDKNGSGDSFWVLNPVDGTLLASYAHGENLKVVASIPGETALVAGDRVV